VCCSKKVQRGADVIQETSFYLFYVYSFDVTKVGAASGGVSATKSEPVVDDNSPEDDVPVGKEMYPTNPLSLFTSSFFGDL
jgi:hypothetical protein